MTRTLSTVLVALSCAGALVGCDDGNGIPAIADDGSDDSGGGAADLDAGESDAGPDTALDASNDIALDAGADASPDVPDVGLDTEREPDTADAAFDAAPIDVGSDAAPDTSDLDASADTRDATPDAAPDAPMRDAGVDAPDADAPDAPVRDTGVDTQDAAFDTAPDAAPDTAPAPRCDDGILNGDEIAVDCGGACVPDGAPTLDDVWDDIIATDCGGCHTGTGRSGGFGLGVNDGGVLDRLLANSVDVPTMPYITPCDVERSYFWHKSAGTQAEVGGSGRRMPTRGTLSTEQLDLLRAWIEAGAPE